MFATGDKTQTASMWTHAITLANWTTKIHLLSCRKNKREFMGIFIQQNSQWRDIKHETETYSLTVCFPSSPRVGHPEFRNVPREASEETGSGAGNHHQLWVAAEQQRRSISLNKHWVKGLVCLFVFKQIIYYVSGVVSGTSRSSAIHTRISDTEGGSKV